MADDGSTIMVDNKTDPKKLGNIMKPSSHQLSMEICKMLEERANAQAAMELKDSLACFAVD
jgi:hypothetical protein